MISKHRTAGLLVFSFCLLLAGLLSPPVLLAQDVEVDSADPNNAAQGTASLNVIVTGKHFDKSAKAKFFVTGTTNPGGITVNSTTFVNPTQLVANITVSSTATTTKFDTVVTLSSTGRTGKGIELFSVTKKGTSTKCTLAPLPSAFTLVGLLNPTGAYSGGGFGVLVRATKITLGGLDVRVVAVSVGQANRLEIFFLDPTSGQILDGTIIGTAGQVQPHITLPVPLQPRCLAFGDFNADGVPDIVVGGAYAYLGIIQNGVLSNSAGIPVLTTGGRSVAAGDLDGNPGDELAVGDDGAGKVYLYKFNALPSPSFALFQTLTSPMPNTKGSDQFGTGVAIADVTGGAAPDVIVEAPNSTLNQPAGPGRVYVFPGYAFGSSVVALSTPGQTSSWVGKVIAGDVDGGYTDVIGIAGTTALVFSGLVSSNQSPTFTLRAVPGFDGSYGNDLDASDLDADSLAEVLTGAPNSSNCPSYKSVGAAYVFMPSALAPTQPPAEYLLQPPSLNSGGTTTFGGYGFATAAVPGSRLFLVGENGRIINGVATGQVYVYRVN